MATDDVRRQQLIQSAIATIASHSGTAHDIAPLLLQPLSAQLIAIIGEGGFNALYDRSFYLTRVAFPALAIANAESPGQHRISELTIYLAALDPADAERASHLLLMTFTNILALLIGESLTLDILSSAWGNHGPESNNAGKEFPHEQ